MLKDELRKRDQFDDIAKLTGFGEGHWGHKRPWLHGDRRNIERLDVTLAIRSHEAVNNSASQ